MSQDNYQPVEDAFSNGQVESQDSETLKKYLLALSNQPIHNELVRHRDIIRGLTINHLLLQRHIETLNQQNSKTQRWFMVFAVIAAIGAVAPYLMPPATVQVQAAIQPQPHTEKLLHPTQGQPQVANPASVKKP
jgi:hypothetical protein